MVGIGDWDWRLGLGIGDWNWGLELGFGIRDWYLGLGWGQDLGLGLEIEIRNWDLYTVLEAHKCGNVLNILVDQIKEND